MPIQEKCRILDHSKVGSSHYKLTLLSQYISSHAQPGQFINVRCSESRDPLLRRPISFHKISAEHETFELLYEVVGRGTELLTKFFVGEELDCLGPLGEGFKVDPAKKIRILVGGGMGVAPLLGLAEQITNDKLQMTNALYVLLGAKTKACILCEEDFRKTTDQVLVATDDGSYGKKGFISDLLLDFINNQLSTFDFQLSTVYSCGPKAMLKAVAEIAFQKKIDCQVSMEERMACGVGACKGCPVKTINGYKMVCKDGPVFDSKEIVFS
jgi:dihydroorotate dehydrogenase electron transfer subunit